VDVSRFMKRFMVPAVVLAALCAGAVWASVPAGAWQAPRFRVHGNQILDPRGEPFVVKGVNAVYGRFAGGDQLGFGLMNVQSVRRDAETLRELGVNLVQIYTAPWIATTGSVPYQQYLDELDHTVATMTARGMVVELGQDQYLSSSADMAAFDGMLAARYRWNPYVWLKPVNEPNCSFGATAQCHDWTFWQQEERAYVAAIRQAGNTAPIIVNGVTWSWDLSQVASHPLGDGDVVFGAHRYANDCATFDDTPSAESPNGQISAVNRLWAGLSATLPVVVDEVGNYDGPAPGYDAGCNGSGPHTWNAFTWVQSYVPWLTDWVNRRSGDGVIAFNWRWEDGNTLTGSPTETGPTEKLNAWGALYRSAYLRRVGGGERRGGIGA
jgi:hypothetical protein